MSPAGKTFATAGMDNLVKVWDLTGKEVQAWDFGKQAISGRTLVRTLAFTPNGKSLVAGNGNSTLYLLDVP